MQFPRTVSVLNPWAVLKVLPPGVSWKTRSTALVARLGIHGAPRYATIPIKKLVQVTAPAPVLMYVEGSRLQLYYEAFAVRPRRVKRGSRGPGAGSTERGLKTFAIRACIVAASCDLRRRGAPP